MRTTDGLKPAALKSKSKILMDAYRQARNRVNSLNIPLNRWHFSAKISECKGNMKESWKTVNELLNRRSKSSNIDCLKDSEHTFDHKKATSNSRNNFLCTIGEKLASKIDAVPNPLLSGEATVNNSSVKSQFSSITVKEIRDAIAKIKTTKGFGKYEISCYFLKIAMPFIEKSLADLFNTSIERSQIPDLWICTRITPLVKEGDKAEMSTYRPMSVLTVIARLFEERIANQLYQHMNDNGYFSEQSGFLGLHSTAKSLVKSTDDWYNGMDLGKLIGVVFIDLKRAFDTVDHDILCQKLEYYGIQGRDFAWHKSYLSNRKQLTRVNGVDSSLQEMKIGVPWGSCLGPLLFLIYINDLPRAVQNSRMSMFADDTCLYHQSSTISLLNEVINEDLTLVD